MRRILLFSELHLIQTFMYPTVTKLKQEAEVEFDCFIVAKLKPKDVIELKTLFTNVYFNIYPSKLLAWLPKLRFFQYMWGLRKLAKLLPIYDVVHVTFHHYYYAFITPIIRKKTSKLYVTFYGSDFNDVSWFRHLCNKKTILLADHIFATNPSMLRKIVKKYDLTDEKKRTSILMHLMKSFDIFENYLTTHCKQASKHDWGVNEKLIVCGYSAAVIVRHEEIIKVLLSIKEELKDYCVIFPMTYGHPGIITRPRVKSLLIDSGLNWQVLEDYLSMENLLALRLAADIFIHIQSRDQMASSMLEHIAAGSVVITGKWLPYESLEELGVYFIRINKVDDLKETLLEVIKHLDIHLELCKKNREIILKLMSWETNKRSWYEVYNLKIK
jgi:glycosyltransferase involved in cell wall biosynthesis